MRKRTAIDVHVRCDRPARNVPMECSGWTGPQRPFRDSLLQQWSARWNSRMDQAGLTQYLVGCEPEAIVRTLAMMAYNPAIGRVLEVGSVVRFADLMAV